MSATLSEAAAAVTAAPLLATASPGIAAVIAPYMGVFFAAFFAALLLTPVMRFLATRNGIVDWPDLQRKRHVIPVAYLGGVAIFLGWLIGIATGYFTPPHDAAAVERAGDMVHVPISIILGAGVITLTGLFDDVYGISPRVKVGGQLFAAAALAWEDVGLRLAESTLSLLGLPVTPTLVYLLGTMLIAVFVIGGCNSINLIDGIDGLAAGVSGIAVLGFLCLAALVAVGAYSPEGEMSVAVDPAGDAVRIVMCLAILGAILGFLPYNFNPATIFMGDAGSLLLGYLCAATMLLFAQVHGAGPKLVTAALIVFALPIADATFAVVRRSLRGTSIFAADSEHLHHLLRRTGRSVRQTVLLLYLVALGFAVLGCTLVALGLAWRYVFAVFAVIYAFIVVAGVKYAQRRAALIRLGLMPPDGPDAPAEPTTPPDTPTDDDRDTPHAPPTPAGTASTPGTSAADDPALAKSAPAPNARASASDPTA